MTVLPEAASGVFWVFFFRRLPASTFSSLFST